MAFNDPRAGNGEDDKFDKELAFDGWNIQLTRNTFLGEVVGQIPRSGTIYIPSRTAARDDKEWHLIVHQLAPLIDDQFKPMGLEIGERVAISGNATGCFFNGMEFAIVPFNAIQGILRRRDGEKFVGSKYGAKAIEEGKPAGKE